MQYVIFSRPRASQKPWTKILTLPLGMSNANAVKEMKWLQDHSLLKDYLLIVISDPLDDSLEGIGENQQVKNKA